MTRLLPLLAAAALLAWLWRQLRGAAGSQTAPPRSQPGDPAWDEDEDGVQWDPWTRDMVWGLVADAERDRRIVAEWDATLPPLDDVTNLGMDARYADAVAVRRATQSGPVGPSA